VFKKRRSAFRRVAATLFAIVALAHVARLVWALPITVGSVAVPQSVSWAGLVLAGAMALWGFGSRS
jgi:hypothetical protein